MSLFKCKMCGGTIEFKEGETVGVCDSCGTKQTLPRLDDKKANLYDRANHFRRNNDYNKAMNIYERILNEDHTDAEAYWSLVLCRYGIEYVEDPVTHKHMPTINRAQFTSIYADEDYKSALQYADSSQRAIYEEEAKTIDEIQKGILEISSKEEPFDVFICYKETDNNGRRTPDSVLANDLYHQLTQEGFQVFFAHITLEDKLGTAYEPYIFAALNSAKVMVVLGTKPEFFEAVWVKNEWSRYLALIKNGARKTLIPAYKDMDPYDLPEEFSHLQAQDMSKLGFMQDLIRGIKKMVTVDERPKETVKETVTINSSNGNVNIAPLLERVFLFLEDESFAEANEYCEKVLDQEPRCAQAYLGKLMAELRVRKQEELADCEKPFDNRKNYEKILRFGDDALVSVLKGYVEQIKERNELKRKTGIYIAAVSAMGAADNSEAYTAAAEAFQTVAGFKDADALAEQCLEKAEACRKDGIYSVAKAKMEDKFASGNYAVTNYERAMELFQSISGWRDADQQSSECQRKIQEIKAREEAERLERERQEEEARREAERRAKRNTVIRAISIIMLCGIAGFIVLWYTVLSSYIKYHHAMALMEEGDYVEAYEAFRGLDEYQDSVVKAREIFEEYKQDILKNIAVNDTLFFGLYEQDNDKANGKEEIEWIVLAREKDMILVISKYALDCQPYHTANNGVTGVTWEKCSLRNWLNDTFFNEAFSENEKMMIPATVVSADANPDYGTAAGNATEDQLFLLSITETEKYLNADSVKCSPTQFAMENNTYFTNGNSWWWLRSPGCFKDYAAFVNSDGNVSLTGTEVNNDKKMNVRPAMWIRYVP